VKAGIAERLWLLPVAALALFCIPMLTGPGQLNGDTSWLITVVEKLSLGAAAYIDVVEPNPPMAFLVYWPAVALAAALGISPEAMVFAQCAVLALASAGLAHAIVMRHFGFAAADAALLTVAVLVALLLVPGRSFTQREHIALAALLPAVLLLAARAEGGRPGMGLALVCGALAGLGACIKPHFVLVLAIPALAASVAQRNWRILVAPETVAAAALFAAYVVVWLWRYPAFFGDIWFATINSYRLYRFGLAEYIRLGPALMALLIGLALVLARTRRRPALACLVAALAAFAIAFVEQGKGFAYHLYPVAALGLVIAAFAALLRASDGRPAAPLPTALAATMLLAGVAAFSARQSAEYPDSTELGSAIVAVKAKPSLIIMGFDIAVNFPLARNLRANWSSRLQSTWISNTAGHAVKLDLTPEQRARTTRAVALEAEWMIDDVVRNKPDVLVLDTISPLDHIRNDPRFRAALDGSYALAGSAQDGRFAIYRRVGG
jgi:hypothetical protein